jgi:hypothetical protein
LCVSSATRVVPYVTTGTPKRSGGVRAARFYYRVRRLCVWGIPHTSSSNCYFYIVRRLCSVWGIPHTSSWNTL